MRIVADESDMVSGWVADRLDTAFHGPHRAIGIERDGKLIAAVVIHEFNGSNAELTIIGKAFFGRTFQAYLRDYARSAGIRRVTVRYRADRPTLTRIAERVGFTIEGYQPAFYPDGGDSLLYGLKV